MKIDFKKIIRDLEEKANNIYENRGKLKELLDSAIKTVKENEQLKEIVDDINLMVDLVKDWYRGKYEGLSKDSLILIIIGLVYLVMPIDLIPDFLPLGFLDDIIVIAYILNKLSVEINYYKKWRQKNDDPIIKSIELNESYYNENYNKEDYNKEETNDEDEDDDYFVL